MTITRASRMTATIRTAATIMTYDDYNNAYFVNGWLFGLSTMTMIRSLTTTTTTTITITITMTSNSDNTYDNTSNKYNTTKNKPPTIPNDKNDSNTDHT